MSPKDDDADKWKRDVDKSGFSRRASSGKSLPKNPSTGKTEQNPPTGKTLPPPNPGKGQTKKPGDDGKGRAK